MLAAANPRGKPRTGGKNGDGTLRQRSAALRYTGAHQLCEYMQSHPRFHECIRLRRTEYRREFFLHSRKRRSPMTEMMIFLFMDAALREVMVASCLSFQDSVAS